MHSVCRADPHWCVAVCVSVCQYYTRCGAVGVASMYVDDSWSGAGSHYKFAQPDVERYLKRARALHAQPHTTAAKLLPFVQALQAARAWLQPHSTALVLGSQEPWYETLLLAWGASRVVTLEYNNLTYAHPLLQTVTPAQFLSSEAGGDYFGPRTFDLVVAVAAVDHDGLGRYGDPLAPDGDLLTMDWMRSLLKSKEQRQQEAQAGEASGGVAGASGVDEGGVLILTAPIGPDLVVWNLERRYGRVRLPLLLEGWRQLHRFGYAEERLDLQENFRKRIEPAWILAPNAHTERTTSHSADGLHHADRSSGEAPHDELR